MSDSAGTPAARKHVEPGRLSWQAKQNPHLKRRYLTKLKGKTTEEAGGSGTSWRKKEARQDEQKEEGDEPDPRHWWKTAVAASFPT
ncbi:MAG: hypothetical protein CPSOU_0245 [uncultured Paraburkholderia sp.]|nr:MAG: hypothetical protein CPSOU_0245 [uncultured Paraburkholderia sp.]